MDQYFYVLEPGRSIPEGPFLAAEITRRMASGQISAKATLTRVGDNNTQPISKEELLDLDLVAELEPEPEPSPPPRAAVGTQPPPVAAHDAQTITPMALVPRLEDPRRMIAPKPRRELPRISRRLALAIGGGALAALALTAAVFVLRSRGVEIKDAMVRVSTSSGTGAGFFIDGPDKLAYVATAYHVVDRGERVLIERDVDISDKRHYVEAYPETEIVASDPDADLAILRIKNVDAKQFQRLPLAKEPVKDEKIFSYGYPGSSLAKHAGLVSKDGKILSLVMFPAYDDRYSRVLRENAVDGLLVSTDIEPGFSGGPTVDDGGRVVGINVTKDHAHVGQNGAVSVVALRKLLDQVKPASDAADPKPADVVALLKRLQSEYLLLPLEERSHVRETEFLAAEDLPELRKFIGEIRREERNTDAELSTLHLSGQAALGIYFARLPGKLLETYRSPTTKGPLAACELSNQRLASFLGDLHNTDRHMETHVQSALDVCDELALRPLAWDLAAATLQWDGKEKDYTVTKIDRMDDEGKTFRAAVRISGAPNLVEIWIGMDQHEPRLKLFDTTEDLYAISSPRAISTSSLQGSWALKQPRVTDAVDKDAEVEADEKVSISIGDDRKVSLRYVINQRYYIAGKHANVFRCNGKKTIEIGLLQSFTGTLENGVVIALPEKDAESIGADAGSCDPRHKADRIVAAKLVGDQMYLYRTDGTAYPETLQFTKE